MKPIGMNDYVSVSLPLFEWNLIKSGLLIESLEAKDEFRRKNAKRQHDAIAEQLLKLDFSANEKIVDKINAKIAKLAI